MGMTKLKLALAVLVVFGTTDMLIVERQARQKLDAENKSLTQQFASLKAENETLSSLAAQAKKSESLPDGWLNELLRLRGEVGMLRQQIDEIGRLQQENQGLVAKIAAHSGPANQLSAADQFTLRQTHVQNAMNTLLAAATRYATNHDGQYPANFDQLTSSGDLKATNFPDNLGLDDFEFMQAGAVGMDGRKLILRNRVPIQKPGEDPVWLYGSIENGGGIITTPADLANSGSNATQTSP
jgi:hypothetical protein